MLRKLYPKKNIKLFYYIKNAFNEIIPKTIYRSSLKSILSNISWEDKEYLLARLRYYNKLSTRIKLNQNTPKLRSFKTPDSGSVYYFDFIEYAKYFRSDLMYNFLGGDITEIPPVPTVTKSRPIAGKNENSILLNLNKVRHFIFIKYDNTYSSKKDKLIWRGEASQEHRRKFLSMYFDHPMCDIGKVKQTGDDDHWLKERISINKHLECKFILSIEGNDVASNLKWVMSSNSIAVMPRPKFETWFMEGTLIPDYHYIVIRDDFSDLEERLHYFLNNPKEAEQIVKNAHEYIRQFKNKKREDLLSLLVLEKYFVKTGQLTQISSIED